MGLNTEVKGDPDSLTATCGWLRGQAEHADTTGDEIHGVRGDSEAGWHEQAGGSFRAVLDQAGKIVDNLAGSLTDTCGALETHADDLRTVRTQMQRARDVATEGGLAIKGYEIQEPGPAPATPEVLPADRPATPQQKQDRAAAAQAAAAFEKKAQA
ncbi:hypothetical protein OOZ19_27725 [Saccharopolyspora sp. NFXS83]|uniref:WXG100 family type VII secretion target n=1 Tax=Saccharopolyspora sp. NFXS83 TaxID=2993560 RepID=UPI00224AE148|nr:hypothetical protein [Saccharopolyspora sp. NFXS83]MCX2734050.1 hypothetical protein [Saccharopolyspora sp. NFXS83]